MLAKSSALASVVALILVSLPAQAHFKLQAPADAIVTDATGDPQKTGPCTGGTASNMVTKVAAGSKLHIKINETVAHGGHYRVSVAANRASFVDAVPVLDGAGQCASVPIQTTPVAPVIADGLFPHVAGAGTVFETDVQMPNTPCANCTLQITEFMTPHAPTCFYYHCANIEIVAGDAGLPDGGVTVEVDAGGKDGGPTTVPTDGGGKLVDAGGEPPATAPADLHSGDGGGCSVALGATSGVSFAVTAGLLALALVRRRRRAGRD